MSVIPVAKQDRSTIALLLAGSSHLVSYFLIAGAALDVLGYAQAPHHANLGIAVLPLALLALTAALSIRPARWTGIVQIVVGTASLYWFAVIILGPGSPVSTTDAGVLSFARIAFILLVVTRRGVVQNLAWCALAFGAGACAVIVTALRTGATIRPDLATTAVIVALLIVLSFSLGQAPFPRARPRLERAAVDEAISAIRSRAELKAAALMHDTVLNHLAAVAAADPGPLQPALRRQIERDLEILVGQAWLADTSPELGERARSEWERSAIFVAVEEARRQSLDVDVTGDIAAVGRMSAERDSAVGLAVAQCLVNVIQHADVRQAEIVIIGSELDVSFMIIDAGRGFSEAHVGADRLGIRQSVRNRIDVVGGDVRLWSTPGRGTSVMIRVPVESIDA